MDFRILGPLEARNAGRSISIGGRKQRALLAVLLLHANEPLPADRLIDELWGEHPPPTALKSLQMHVSRLRRVLDGGTDAGEATAAGIPETSSGGYVIRLRDEQLDLARFERHAAEGRALLAAGRPEDAAREFDAALAEWRGPPLADLALEPFAQRDVARLEELHVALREDRIEADLACGRHAEVVGDIEALAAEHPFRERLRGQLMLALYRSGRQAEALAAYRDTRSVLVEELGLEPGRAVQDLHAAILAQDPALDFAPAAGAAPSGPPAPMPGRLRDTPAGGFVGREAQYATALRAWGDAAGGTRRLALLSGEPGIGKTRLAAEVALELQQRGATVLYGQCDENVRVPYRPWLEALRRYVIGAPHQVLARHAAAHGGWLTLLVPELAQRLADPPPPARASDPEAERYLLYGAVAGLLADASADRPLLLVLDDLHWADKPTLLLLRHVITAAEPMRLLVLGAYRDSDVTAEDPLADLLADLHREPGVERLRLEGLDEAHVTELIAHGGAPEPDGQVRALARELTRETDGNPFFLTQMLRHLNESGDLTYDRAGWRLSSRPLDAGLPDSLREVIGRRVARLGGGAADILPIAAVIGREFDVDLLATVAGADADAVLDALEAATAAKLLNERGDPPGRFAFTHALVNHTLYGELGATRRARLHGRIAAALERLPEALLAPRLGELARHWEAAGGDPGKALDASRRAAEHALGQLAPDEAIRWFERALALLDGLATADAALRCDLLTGLGEAQRQAGDPRFRATLLDACRLADGLGDGVRLARAALANSRGFESASGSVDRERVAMLESALALLPEGDGVYRARLLAMLQLELTFIAPLAERRRLSDEAVALARAAGDLPTLASVLWARHAVLWTPDCFDEHCELAADLRTVAAQVDDPVTSFWAACDTVLTSVWTADADGIDAGLHEMRAIADHVGQPLLRWVLLWYRAWRAHLYGRLGDAEELANRAAAIGTASGQADAVAFLADQLVVIRWDQGRLGELVPLLEQAVEEHPGLPVFRAWLCLAYLEVDRPDDAREAFASAASARFEDVPHDIVWLPTMCLYAEVCARLDAAGPAAELYDLIAPYAHRVAFSATTVLGSAARFLGLLAAVLGRHDAADGHFASALAVHERLGAPVLAARTRRDRERAIVLRDQMTPANRAEGDE